MSLESLQQTQTPTRFTLRSHTQLPVGATGVLLIVVFLVGLPVLVLGLFMWQHLVGLTAHLIGGLLVILGLLPPLGTIYLLIDSLLTNESCIFDKTLNQVIFKQQDGIFKVNSAKYSLDDIRAIEVLEDTHLLHDEEPCPVYQLVVRLKSNQCLPINSQPCYYEEIAEQLATDLQDFLKLGKMPENSPHMPRSSGHSRHLSGMIRCTAFYSE
ncbi:MAG: DUF4564 domain-containing protein [Scytolyngbya sp. HA4215-MV1]|jgi:hypothetical protein|nr:DUF4564 domain-containing protein [Scytolyngbya sp. HA4215-MV1]